MRIGLDAWQRISHGKLGMLALLTVPVLLYTWPVWHHLPNLAGQDWDYFFAHYEVLRKTLLEFHQLPWWNPYVAGGTPLYADPQIGVISLQTPLVLLFGTAAGLKMAAVCYFVLGFWGMYALLKHLRADAWLRVTLSYIWVFGGYTALHFYAGHYSFLLFLLAPGLLWLFLRKVRSMSDLIWYALAVGLFVNSAPHNTAVQSLFVLAGATALELFIRPSQRRSLLRANILAGLLVFSLVLPKLLYVYQYVHDFPRLLSQSSVDLGTLLRAFFWPFQNPLHPNVAAYHWWEYGAYTGFLIAVAFLVLSGRQLWQRIRHEPPDRGGWFLLAAWFFIILGIGAFAAWSPYALLNKLPALNAMRISTRWFGWVTLFMLLAVGVTTRQRRALRILTAGVAIELFFLHQGLLNVFTYPSPASAQHGFALYAHYPRYTDSGGSMYPAIRQGYGELYGYEPIIQAVPYFTDRRKCGVNNGCPALVSSNATVKRWSPNHLELERRGEGEIIVQLNPGNYWLVNGRRLWSDQRVVEPGQVMKLSDKSRILELAVNPPHWRLVWIFSVLMLVAVWRVRYRLWPPPGT